MKVSIPGCVHGRETDDRSRHVYSEGQGGVGKEGRDGEERPRDIRGLATQRNSIRRYIMTITTCMYSMTLYVQDEPSS